MAESLPAPVVQSMEGPFLPLPRNGVGLSSFGKSTALGVLVPTSWVGAAACLPQEFASLLNAAPFGKESRALYKQPGARIAPKEAQG